MQVQQSIRNVSEREYNIVLKNGGIIWLYSVYSAVQCVTLYRIIDDNATVK